MRTRRGLVASGWCSALLVVAMSAVDPAAGPAAAAAVGAERAEAGEHVHAPDHESAHLAEDLVGTPLRVIEKRTAEAAARI